MEKSKIRIVSDGTAWGTTVFLGVEPLPGVIKVEWVVAADTKDPLATATVTFINTGVDLVGEYQDEAILSGN